MLVSLDIRDILIIEKLSLDFHPGLNVLTGETGAVKSILLDALGFVLGWRGRAELVRTGAAQGEVTAVFALPAGHPAHAILADAGLPGGDELILRRVNAGDGRKTAFINDRRASGEALRALSDVLVELHGQHDDRGLLDPRGHRQILDSFADVGAAKDLLRGLWHTMARARKSLAEAEAALAAARSEEEYLRHAVAELDKLSPEAGEEAVLDIRRRTMQGAARIREDVWRALQALGADGAEGQMVDALRWLETVADRAGGTLEAPVAALGRALTELGEASQGVELALDTLSFDAHELETTEERLFAIRGLARKHSVAPDDLGPFADDLRARLQAIDGGAGNIGRLGAELAAAQAAYDAAAGDLTTRRRAAAQALDQAMAGELGPLKMERAVFRTDITPGEPGPEGHDTVAFTVATNPGAPAGPLNRIASGGELSRFLLALKVCLAKGNDALTMIFDEIDRGVGGATADAVGRRLARLAGGAQVLVVTHSPQVAAMGDQHWRVEKRVENDLTTSHVVPLSAEERVDELARMLAGEEVTSAARAAARSLIDARRDGH